MSDDPLDGADVGETATVSRTVELRGVDYGPGEAFASDRMHGDLKVASVDVVERDEYESVEVTFETEVTKILPRRWDRRVAPVTDSERRQARRQKWLASASKLAAFVIPTIVSVAVGLHVINNLAMTVNGEMVSAPDPIPFLAFVGIITAIVSYAVGGGLPRRIGGAR